MDSNIIKAEDLRASDELLGPVVTENAVNEAYDSLYLMANTLGIDEEDVQLTYLVKRYLTVYSLWSTAMTKSYSAGPAFGDKDSDAYAKKAEMYSEELRRLETKLTMPEAFLGVTVSEQVGYRSVSLARG